MKELEDAKKRKDGGMIEHNREGEDQRREQKAKEQ